MIAAEHPFGGAHTDDKLARVRAYLRAFTSALKHQGFTLVYIDAFAGSGDRTDVIPVLPLLDGDDAEPQTVNVPGSARLAIGVNPPFDRLVLIENDTGRHAALDQLRAEFPDRKIECHRDDANAVVANLCRTTHGTTGEERAASSFSIPMVWRSSGRRSRQSRRHTPSSFGTSFR